ncbi:9704_t:CDS:1, partial [Entrophospora sp. SA101]
DDNNNRNGSRNGNNNDRDNDDYKSNDIIDPDDPTSKEDHNIFIFNSELTLDENIEKIRKFFWEDD